jgi:hypothetical protein
MLAGRPTRSSTSSVGRGRAAPRWHRRVARPRATWRRPRDLAWAACLVTNSLVNQGDAVAGGGSLAWLLGRLALALLTCRGSSDGQLAGEFAGWLASRLADRRFCGRHGRRSGGRTSGLSVWMTPAPGGGRKRARRRAMWAARCGRLGQAGWSVGAEPSEPTARKANSLSWQGCSLERSWPTGQLATQRENPSANVVRAGGKRDLPRGCARWGSWSPRPAAYSTPGAMARLSQ